MIGQRLRDKQDGDAVNIAPLIDMVFILLIFFMVTTTFVRDAKLDLDRPGAKTTTVANGRSLRVSVGHRGELFVNERPVRPWMLQAQLRRSLQQDRAKDVLVIADRRVDTGKLVKVVDQCRLAGARSVGVAVEQEM